MIKDDLELYIKENYYKLLKAAQNITKDDTAEDLLHDVLVYILTRENYSNKLINCTNYYNYLYKAMVLQHLSTTSEYNKQYKRYKYLDFEIEQDTTYYDMTLDEILSWVKDSKIFDSKIKNLESKTIFFNYYSPTFILNITGMTIQQVNSINKTSQMKVARKYNISKSSVRNACNDVVIKIKNKFNK